MEGDSTLENMVLNLMLFKVEILILCKDVCVNRLIHGQCIVITGSKERLFHFLCSEQFSALAHDAGVTNVFYEEMHWRHLTT